MKSLRIKRFRGIKDLSITDLSFVNIFIGSNGVGKTTVLEAAAVVAGNAADVEWIERYNGWRDMPASSIGVDYALRSVFYGMGGNEPLEFEWSANWGSGKIAYRLLPARNQTVASPPEVADRPASDEPVDRYDGVAIDFQALGKKAETREVRLELKRHGQVVGLQMQMSPALPPRTGGPGVFFIHARRASSIGETADMLTAAIENHTDAMVLAAVQKLNPRVKRIIPGFRNKHPVVLADLGFPRAVPVTALGDGFLRIMLMITGAMRRRTGYLIVDEIDSGLHHSVMGGCWASLLELRKNRPFQILCTTHSEEMLRLTLEPFADQPDLLRVFRIDRQADDTLSLKTFNYETLRDASFAEFEIR